MKKMTKHLSLLIAALLFTSVFCIAQNVNDKKETSTDMKTYVIEREIPNAGKLTAEELKNISKVSCAVLKEMGSSIQWMHSYVTGDKIYCIYKAKNKGLVMEHAKKGGFPANSVSEVATVISPETAN